MWRYTDTLLLITILFASAGLPAAPSSAWHSFSSADGLPSNQVLSLAQDASRTLWVGTDAGLSSFFAGRFQQEAGMPVNVSQARINALLATPDRQLWVAGNTGLHRRDGDGRWQENLEKTAGLDVIEIHALLQTADGRVWIGSHDGGCGLAAWDERAAVWESVTIAEVAPCVVSLAEDSSGRLWVADPVQIQILDAGNRLVQAINTEAELPPGAEIRAMLAGASGRMWLATTEGLILIRDGRVTRTYTETDGLSDHSIAAVHADKQGRLWVGTGFGLDLLVEDNLQQVVTSADGLAGDAVQAVFSDDEGNLWVGTDEGLSRSPVSQWWTETDPYLYRTSVNLLLAGTASGDYAATPDGIARRSSTEGTWRFINEGLSSRRIHALAVNRAGELWIGTDGGLGKLAGDQYRPDLRIPTTQIVTALLIDRQDNLWVGTHHGLYRLGYDDRISFYSKASGEIGQDSVLALWLTASGDVWVGTLNGGASRFRQGDWTLIDQQSSKGGLPDNIVLAGLEDPSGNLWFGTSQGLGRLLADSDPAAPASWFTWTAPEIADNRVNALWNDSRHPERIWVGTDGGLSLVVGSESSTFTVADGLSHRRILALGQGGDLELWIGTALGLTYHRDAGSPPQLVPLPLLVDGRECDAQCLEQGIPFQAKTATFRFQASDLGDLEGIRYRYSLRPGAEQPASELTSSTTLPLQLSPGVTYTFTVQAIDKHFNASPVLEPMVLSVKTPTAWERLTNHPQFPLIAALFIAISLLVGGSVSIPVYRAWRATKQYPYNDLHVTVVGNDEGLTARLEARRISLLRPQGPLGRYLAWLPRLGPLHRLPLTSDHGQINLDYIHEARRLWQQTDDPGRIPPPVLRSIGELLFQSLFPTKQLVQELEDKLGLGRQGLRLRLPFSAHPALAGLPWELLHTGDQLGYLARHPQITLVRYSDPQEAWRRPQISDRLRVLIVMAQPREAERLDLKDARSRLDQTFQNMEGVTVEYLLGVHAAELLGEEVAAEDLPARIGKCLEKGWDILHFAGHAGPDRLTEDGGAEVVLWCEDRRGDYLALTAGQLQSYLEPLAGQRKVPKLVILDACQTASIDSDLLQSMLDSGVGAVIGMQWPVLDLAARAFAENFYRALGRHGQVDYAVSVARHGILQTLQDVHGRYEWAAPVLVMQTADGLIFERV